MPTRLDAVSPSGAFMRALWRHRGERAAVTLLLETAQRERGWVTRPHLELIAAVLDLPLAELESQVERHPELRAEPPGSHLIQTCDGLACHLGAGDRLHGVLARELGIQPGQTTADGRVTWRAVPCLGACVRAPAMAVDGEVFGPLDGAEAAEILRELRSDELRADPVEVLPPPAEGRVVRLTGRVRRPCLVQVDPGTRLSELVERVGGGTPNGAPFKAALCGSRLCPAWRFEAPLPPPEGLELAGETLQILVIDESVCVVGLMVLLLSRAAARACGRCALGRLGTRRMLVLAEGIQRGTGHGGIEALEALAPQVAGGARCGGCRAPAQAVADALTEFPREVWAHAVTGHCTAGACGVAP
ncbi:MAG: NAD(P)H-dependent oxidoreductase subunit E [Pseudomonadota bacterium]